MCTINNWRKSDGLSGKHCLVQSIAIIDTVIKFLFINVTN